MSRRSNTVYSRPPTRRCSDSDHNTNTDSDSDVECEQTEKSQNDSVYTCNTTNAASDSDEFSTSDTEAAHNENCQFLYFPVLINNLNMNALLDSGSSINNCTNHYHGNVCHPQSG